MKKSVLDRDEFSLEAHNRSTLVGNVRPPMLRKGKLIVVDLAGSERIHKSGLLEFPSKDPHLLSAVFFLRQ